MEIIAHRGNNNHEFRENTLEAVIDSINKDYIDGVEIDIRLTKDKKLVVIHDYLINEVSDGIGAVKDMTLKQLYEYNFGTEEHPARITTLEEILKNVTNGKKIMIEIKEESSNFIPIVEELIRVLKRYPNRNVAIISFNYSICRYLKKNFKYKVGLLIGIKMNTNKFYNNFNFNSINYRHIRRIIFRFKKNYVWTINTEKQFNKIKKRVIRYNIGIVTDKAYLVKDWL